jgi:hypothetical protein
MRAPLSKQEAPGGLEEIKKNFGQNLNEIHQQSGKDDGHKKADHHKDTDGMQGTSFEKYGTVGLTIVLQL